jgi:cation transport protein ChaC
MDDPQPSDPNGVTANSCGSGPAGLGMTRERILDGTLRRMLQRASPGMTLLTDAERAASLAAILDGRPDRDHGAWLFCYGSLIWNPTIAFDETRVASVRGWHRAFCLQTRAGRGTPDLPGLVLGLAEGGACTGVALHVAESTLVEELTIVWAREMVSGAYHPRWLALHAPDGTVFGHGIAFTMNQESSAYAGDLAREETIRRLAFAAGELGSSAEYLFRTRDGLRGHGIHDAEVESLSDQVAALQRAAATEA